MSRGRTAGLIGGAVGILAAGAAVGVAVERYAIGRIRSGPDENADEPYDRLPADRSRVVVAEDGVPLYVEEVGPVDAPLTVVFCHGYGLAMGSWHYQRRDLPGLLDRPIRMVFYDQRCHGRSGRGDAVDSTVEQLGRDLAAVLGDLSGPVVLVGHSLGGMTIMALAEQEPEWFGERIVGVALLSTSAGMISELKLSLPAALASLRRPFIPVVARGMTRRPALLERGRRVGADIAWLLTRRYAFGDGPVSPALVGYVERMIAATPVDVLGEFLPVVMSYDKRDALPPLARVPTVIVVGTRDLLTSPDHSAAIAAALPDAELVELPGAGHLALMERASETNEILRKFLTEEAL
jgi:pimeloyl-ACP methyl ester carboxylesterase